MKKKCYINGMSCISAQNTFDNNDAMLEVQPIETHRIVYAHEPSYKEFIAPTAIRRMAKGVKMGIATSARALEEARLLYPQAIITGTGMGCTQDSEKFLKALIDNDEQFLTPTSFIQSTHNTVAGQIALGMKCNSYNFTYVNGGVSFESALLDALIQIECEQTENALVGAVDEISQHTMDLFSLCGIIKNESDMPYSVHRPSAGIVFGEGASFFVLDHKKQDTTYAQLIDVAFQNELLPEEWETFANDFLAKNNLNFNDIDVVILGINGDTTSDFFYENPQKIMHNSAHVYYKHLTGEFDTASGVGLWTACQIIKKQHIPQSLLWNGHQPEKIHNVLIYNQFMRKDHSLVLVREV